MNRRIIRWGTVWILLNTFGVGWLMSECQYSDFRFVGCPNLDESLTRLMTVHFNAHVFIVTFLIAPVVLLTIAIVELRGGRAT